MRDLAFEVEGLGLELCPERAAFVPERRELLIADVHLGKAAAFRRAGRPLPRGTTAAELARIDALVERKEATRVTFLGDLFHAEVELGSPTATVFGAWLAARREDLEIRLVRGNHDRHAVDLIAAIELDAAPEPLRPTGVALDYRHHPAEEGAWIAGHVHPGIRFDDGADVVRLPIFWQRACGGLVLPAFGRFTGLYIVEPAAGERLALATPTGVVELPAAGVARRRTRW